MTRVYKVTVEASGDPEDYNYAVTIERKGDTIGVVNDHMFGCQGRIGSIIMADVEDSI